MTNIKVTRPHEAFIVEFLKADSEGHTSFTAALGWREADDLQRALQLLLLDWHYENNPQDTHEERRLVAQPDPF